MGKNMLRSFSGRFFTVSAVATLAISGFLLAVDTFAGTGLSATPNFPASVTVGDTNVPVSLTLGNASTADEGNVTLSSITLVPSCGDTAPGCGTPDTGVFAVSSTGTGHVGTSCAGDSFTIATTNATTGQVTFTRTGGPLVLAFGASCQIDFTVNVLKAPATDVNNVQTGIQTAQLGAASGTSALGNPASGTGTDFTTVNKLSPSIATLLSASTVNVGQLVHDSATLTGATASASGTVTYHAYAGANTCTGTDLLNSTKTVTNHIVPDSNAISFVSSGTYSFQAVYSGDANNNGATSVCSTEQLVVNSFTSSLHTDIHSGATDSGAPVVVTSVAAGSTVHDSATLTFSGPTPTGTVSFTFFPNATCAIDTGTSAGSVAINGSGVADPSTSKGPLTAGSYSFRATWPGNTTYPNGATGACEPLTVTKRQPTLSTTPTPTSGNIGTVLNDSATLTGGYIPTGSITFKLFSPTDSTCSSTAAYSQVVALSGTTASTSPGFTSNASGTWHWTADYPGDVNNLDAHSGCQAEPVTINQFVAQYCSPGYWKQPQHFDSYVTYSPNDLFNTVFGVNAFPGMTLVQVLSQGGGGLNAYGRAAVGALLNAASLQSGLTPAQVILKVQATIAGAPSGKAANGYYGSANPEFTALENCPLN